MNIIDKVFGRKYYANIICTRGTARFEIAMQIFLSHQEAEVHRQSLEDNRSFAFIETISFRSRKSY